MDLSRHSVQPKFSLSSTTLKLPLALDPITNKETNKKPHASLIIHKIYIIHVGDLYSTIFRKIK